MLELAPSGTKNPTQAQKHNQCSNAYVEFPYAIFNCKEQNNIAHFYTFVKFL